VVSDSIKDRSRLPVHVRIFLLSLINSKVLTIMFNNIVNLSKPSGLSVYPVSLTSTVAGKTVRTYVVSPVKRIEFSIANSSSTENSPYTTKRILVRADMIVYNSTALKENRASCYLNIVTNSSGDESNGDTEDLLFGLIQFILGPDSSNTGSSLTPVTLTSLQTTVLRLLAGEL
jgi:hypothetical protein